MTPLRTHELLPEPPLCKRLQVLDETFGMVWPFTVHELPPLTKERSSGPELQRSLPGLLRAGAPGVDRSRLQHLQRELEGLSRSRAHHDDDVVGLVVLVRSGRDAGVLRLVARLVRPRRERPRNRLKAIT